VWSWNAAIAWVCGDVTVWKPSSKTPLCAVACQQIAAAVFAKNNVPEGVSCLVSGNACGDLMNADERIPLISFTGSTRIGKGLLRLSPGDLVEAFSSLVVTMRSLFRKMQT
jgi:aldehyde dehydrogenase (NAD+)